MVAKQPLNKPLFSGGGSFDGGSWEGHDLTLVLNFQLQLRCRDTLPIHGTSRWTLPLPGFLWEPHDKKTTHTHTQALWNSELQIVMDIGWHMRWKKRHVWGGNCRSCLLPESHISCLLNKLECFCKAIVAGKSWPNRFQIPAGRCQPTLLAVLSWNVPPP